MQGGPHYPEDPARLRVSDQERHQIAELLRLAAGEGRIDLEELDERLEATYAAKTYADLVPLTADLPATGEAVARRPAGHVVAGPAYQSSFAMMSETRRSGPWQVGASHTAFALMGSVVLDLRQAVFAAPEVVINASCLMGSVEIQVNSQTVVIVEGTGILGDFSEARPKAPDETRPDSPVVRVKGVAVMGSVEVRRKPLPGEKSRRFLSR